MSEGFVIDDTHGGYTAAAWHPGAIVRSFWTGVKIRKASRVDITTWRCERCGYLESYAPPGPKG